MFNMKKYTIPETAPPNYGSEVIRLKLSFRLLVVKI